MTRIVIQGAKSKRYDSLHRGKGGQKLPKLALRNFWTAPYSRVYLKLYNIGSDLKF